MRGIELRPYETTCDKHDEQKASKGKHGDSKLHLSHQLALALFSQNFASKSCKKMKSQGGCTLSLHVARAGLCPRLLGLPCSLVPKRPVALAVLFDSAICKSMRMKTYEKDVKRHENNECRKPLVASTLLRSTIQKLCYFKENVKIKFSHFEPSDDCVW